MPADPIALIQSIGKLYDLDVAGGFEGSMRQVVTAAEDLLSVDSAGLMLADHDGNLRWASASDRTAQLAEERQEWAAAGPCAEAFEQRAPLWIDDLGDGHHDLRMLFAGVEIKAALSVPVELRGGPIGTLDLYAAAPRKWDETEIAAASAYSGVIASLLGAAASVSLKGTLVDQLLVALEHRVLIEQAKGVLMERDGLDAAAAWERIRAMARSSRRKTVDVVRELLPEPKERESKERAQGRS